MELKNNKELKYLKKVTNKKQKDYWKIFNSLAVFFTIMGISIFLSVISTINIRSNFDKFVNIMTKIDHMSSKYLVIGLLLLTFALIIFILKYSEDFSISIILIFKQFGPIFFCIGMIYQTINTSEILYFNENSILRYNYYFYFITILFATIFYTCYQILKSTILFLKINIPDSKDRLSIVITIVATIVSFIALFK